LPGSPAQANIYADPRRELWAATVQPSLKAFPLRVMAHATGLTKGYCSFIRCGLKVPHRRHYGACRACDGAGPDLTPGTRELRRGRMSPHGHRHPADGFSLITPTPSSWRCPPRDLSIPRSEFVSCAHDDPYTRRRSLTTAAGYSPPATRAVRSDPNPSKTRDGPISANGKELTFRSRRIVRFRAVLYLYPSIKQGLWSYPDARISCHRRRTSAGSGCNQVPPRVRGT